MPRRRCLECPAYTVTGSRCDRCKARRKAIRNADIPIARAVVAASPRCAICGTTEDLTADHLIPLARGGTNEGKRQVLCRSHNSSKGAR